MHKRSNLTEKIDDNIAPTSLTLPCLKCRHELKTVLLHFMRQIILSLYIDLKNELSREFGTTLSTKIVKNKIVFHHQINEHMN